MDARKCILRVTERAKKIRDSCQPRLVRFIPYQRKPGEMQKKIFSRCYWHNLNYLGLTFDRSRHLAHYTRSFADLLADESVGSQWCRQVKAIRSALAIQSGRFRLVRGIRQFRVRGLHPMI